MLGLAGARRRARQMRFAASRAKSTDQTMDCGGIQQVTAPKGSFKHLAQSLVRSHRSLKTGEFSSSGPISGAGYGCSRGTFRKKDSENALKSPWDSQLFFGYSAKYALYVQGILICIMAAIAVTALLKGPIQTKNIRNITNSRTGYSVSDFYTAMAGDKCTMERIDFNYLTEELFNLTYRLQRPFILSHRKGAKYWLDSKLWDINTLSTRYGSLNATHEAWDITMDAMNTEESTLKLCLENMKGSKQHISGNNMCFLNDSTITSSDLLTQLKLPPFPAQRDSGLYSYTTQVSCHGSSIGWKVSPTDMWSGLVHGGKRWLVTSANTSAIGASFLEDPHNLVDWMNVAYPDLLEQKVVADCSQQPGDILYIPEMFNFLEITTVGSISLQTTTSSTLTQTGKLYQTVHDMHASTEQQTGTLKKLHNLLPGNSDVVFKLADALELTDHIIEAIEVLQAYVKNAPENPEALYKLADLFDKAGRDNEAEDIYEDMRKKIPVTPKTYSQLSQFLLGQKKSREATQLLHEAVLKYPSKLYLWDLLISSLRQSGEKAKAKQVEREVKKWRNV